MKKVACVIVAFVACAAWTHDVSAHVFVTDDTHSRGAVIHIIPDDDPVAGQAATVYFDMQNKAGDEQKSNVTLIISNKSGSTQNIPMRLDDNLATATVVFAEQGPYTLRVQAATRSGAHTFTHTQYVSRGTQAGGTQKSAQVWAEVALIGGGVGFLVLAIIAFNRRHDIARQSTI